MNSTNPVANPVANPEAFSTDPPVSLLERLTVRALEPHEYERAGQLLDQEHPLGLEEA